MLVAYQESAGVYRDVSPAYPLPVTFAAATSGGLSFYRNLDLGTTGQVAKASAGQVYGYTLTNRSAGERFVKFYDKATAATSADTPVETVVLPPGTSVVYTSLYGVAYANGVGVRASTGLADNDNTAPSTNDVVVGVRYK